MQGDIRESELAYAMCRAICEDRAEWNGLDVDRYQSIVLPADDPREKDRIPPAGCPWRRFFARNVDAGLYGLLWSMLAQWVFRINPENFIQLTASLAWTLACGVCRLAADVRVRAGAAALLGHNARQVDLRAVRPR